MNADFRHSGFIPLLILLLFVGLPAAGQDVQVTTTGSETESAEPSEAREPSPTDEAFEPLRKDFANLYRTLVNMQGLNDENRPAVEAMAVRSQSFLDEHPEYTPAVVLRLQLAMWLKQTEQIDSLFEKLLSIDPEREEFAYAWIRHAQQQEDEAAIERVYERLTELQPDNKDLILRRAEAMRDQTRYADALELVERTEFDLAEHTGAAVLKSDLLFADNRFEESLAALDAIPADVLIGGTPEASQAQQDRELREDYIEYWKDEQEKRAAEADRDDLPRVELLTDKGRIVLELFEDDAPNTVANFITLIEQEFYTTMPFHRVLPNFMAQVGSPASRENAEPGTPDGPGYRIADEHGSENDRRHFAGSVSMAKQPIPDSAGSQFFLAHRPTNWLNGQHTVFGRVMEGLDVARKLEQGDLLQFARVLRKRDHEYTVEKLEQAELPIAQPLPEQIDIGDIGNIGDIIDDTGDGQD